MLAEYEDMIILCRRGVELLTLPIRNGLIRHLVRSVFGTFLLLAIYLLLFSHLTACVFIFTEKIALETEISGQDPWTRYISVLYFMVTTSTTVGYGDITIDHKSSKYVFIRYSYQVLLMMMSLLVNSVFYTLINATVNDVCYILDKMQEPIEEFDYFLAVRIKKMNNSNGLNKFYLQNTTNFNFRYNFNKHKRFERIVKTYQVSDHHQSREK